MLSVGFLIVLVTSSFKNKYTKKHKIQNRTAKIVLVENCQLVRKFKPFLYNITFLSIFMMILLMYIGLNNFKMDKKNRCSFVRSFRRRGVDGLNGWMGS